MLSPKDLHKQYSQSPCASRASFSSPYSQLTVDEVFNPLSYNDMGAGTPMNWLRAINFLKHVKHPCVWEAPNFDTIDGTGEKKFALTFRFLQQLDGEAYTERQPTIRAGVSHSVRNACDLSRACYYIANDADDTNTIGTHLWTHRMATEYLEHFAYNSLPDCLMMCGPDLVPDIAAGFYRAPGHKVDQDEPTNYSGAANSDRDPGGVILDKMIQTDKGMLCIPKVTESLGGVAGADHRCYTVPETDPPETNCVSCQECPTDPITGEVLDPSHPCCNEGIYKANECCNNTLKSFTERSDFSYWVPSDDGSFDGTILNGRIGEEFKHIGILERKSYGGYANFAHQCSGSEPPIILKDMFLKHFREMNGYDYDTNVSSPTGSIERARTISLILSATIDAKANVTTNTDIMLKAVRDLVYNGYGVLLATNVGFPNVRDSTGICYPDRIFYQTYNIVGYDASQAFYPETVYVLHCPFGNWITGGDALWGELPTGCFLVTEDRLRCMISYYPTTDFYGCRKKPCPPPFEPDLDCDSLQPHEKQEYNGCGGGYEGRCDPYYCTKIQQAFGFLYAISMTQGFPRQRLDHGSFFPSWLAKSQLRETDRMG
jgi:hypothetical protein